MQVSEIEARSALLKWGPPVRDQADPKFEALEHILDVMFRYEVILNGFDTRVVRLIFNRCDFQSLN